MQVSTGSHAQCLRRLKQRCLQDCVLSWKSRSSSELAQAVGRNHFLMTVGVRFPYPCWLPAPCSAPWGLPQVLATWPLASVHQLTSPNQQENLSSWLRWTHIKQSNHRSEIHSIHRWHLHSKAGIYIGHVHLGRNFEAISAYPGSYCCFSVHLKLYSFHELLSGAFPAMWIALSRSSYSNVLSSVLLCLG